MKRISFKQQFVNKEGNDLIPGKIHTIRKNYEYWKKFEGKDIALFTWEGKPYGKGSEQKVFCVKKIVSVQKIIKKTDGLTPRFPFSIYRGAPNERKFHIILYLLCERDGLSSEDFIKWFADYPDGEMAIIHFTDFRY